MIEHQVALQKVMLQLLDVSLSSSEELSFDLLFQRSNEQIYVMVSDTQDMQILKDSEQATYLANIFLLVLSHQAARQGLAVLMASAVVVLKHETSSTYQSLIYESIDLKSESHDRSFRIRY